MNVSVRFAKALACAALMSGILVSTSYAAPTSTAAQAEASLRQTFPKLMVGEVSESPIDGLFEVISGDNILYYSPQTKHVIFGEIWAHTGKNITTAAKDRINAKKIAMYNPHLADAVKVGNGPNVVIEITDPDCPFCRKMNNYWQGRTDVTRYVFLHPIPSLHPQAEAKVRYILSAKDKVKALHEVFSGAYDSKPLPAFKEDVRLSGIHLDLAAKSGINGTPAFFVNGSFVSGANIPLIEQNLKKGENKQ